MVFPRSSMCMGTMVYFLSLVPFLMIMMGRLSLVNQFDPYIFRI